MFSESSSAASYKLIARAKSPWADLLSASCINCAWRGAPSRSQPPTSPQIKKIDKHAQATTAGLRKGETKQAETDRRLSAHHIVANLLTYEPARTSILFRCSDSASFCRYASARRT